jgi:hypothetical protein
MDDLRSTLDAAVVEHSDPVESAPVETSSPVESAPIDVTPTSKTIEPRGITKTDTYETPVEKSTKPRSIDEVVTDEQPVEKSAEKPTGDPRIDRAPQSWKGDAKKLWAELPLSARQEVVRRERETAKVMQETAQIRQNFGQVQEALAPHMERIGREYGGNPITAINTLMSVDKTLRTGTPAEKAQLVANTIKRFGVDISALDNLLAGEELPAPVQQMSQIEQLLEQRLAPVQQFLQKQQQSEQQQAYRIEQEAVQTVESMSDNPQFPYFDDVREDMADLIEMSAKRGIAVSMEEAYSRAVRMNDTTYQAVQSRQSSQSATQAALAAHQQAQKAKGAAVSVSGNPSAAGNSFSPSDLRGTIEAAFGNSGGRL